MKTGDRHPQGNLAVVLYGQGNPRYMQSFWVFHVSEVSNPEFYKAQAMRLPTHEKPRMIACIADYPDHIGLPRGCLEDVYHLFSELKIKLTIRDELQPGIPLDTKFLGELRGEQKTAAATMLKTNFGVLSATTAFGKTVIGAWLISKRKVNALILVHRKQLQEQWIERLSTFLELPKNE